MRIVHVDCGEVMQGGQWQVLYLLRGLREHGHEVRLLARGELAHRAAGEGFDVSAARIIPQADIFHVHDSRAHTLAVLQRARPLVVSRRVGFSAGRGTLSRWKYGRATHFIAVSRFTARTLAEAGLKPERISVVYDGVPIADYQEPKADGPVLAVWKDPMKDLLLQAARTVPVETEAFSADRAVLARASAFAYITALQGLGSAALIAMAAGVPVIASAAAGGLPEVIDNGRTGLLVDNTVESIAAALKRLRQDRPFALRLSRDAHAAAAARFSTKVMVEETERVYERLLG